jgi:predicted porin
MTGGRFTHSEFNEVLRTYYYAPIIVSPTIGYVPVIGITDKQLPPQTSDTWGWIGQMSLSYVGLFASGSLSIGHQLAPGRTSVTEQTLFSLSTSYKFTSELEANLGAAYQLNNASRGEFATGANNDNFLSLSAGGSYLISRNVALTGTYLWQRFRTTGAPVNNNYVALGLKFSYPLFDIISPPGVLEGY